MTRPSCLLVIAHPLEASLCRRLATTAERTLRTLGVEAVVEDLHRTGFDPRLSEGERASYYGPAYAPAFDPEQARRLAEAERIVLVFPTWWFGFPAVLKGWFDRVWAPGIAYDHAPGYGAIVPRLTRLRSVTAITTLGSPWWVDRFVLGRPVEAVLRRAIVGTCAPQAKLRYLALYGAERLDERRIAAFERRIEQALRSA